MNTFSVLHPTLDLSRRIIVISDIHGNLSYLKGLLDKIHLAPEDQLILLGDIVEKGPESLKTLQYALTLPSQCRLYTVLGNCDFWHLWADGYDFESAFGVKDWDRETLAHLLRQKSVLRSGLILEMCSEAGIELTENSSLPEVKAALLSRFPEEFEFLRQMPFALETDRYVFVHGGIPKGETLQSAGAWRCMKVDNYYASKLKCRKWTVTGHTPVCLYGKDRLSAVPIIDRRRKFITIDGGCVLKDDGQLNALIIQNGRFSVDWYDPFPVAVALDKQAESSRSAYIRWGDNMVTPIELGREFCRVRHIRTGYEMDVPTDFLFEKNGELFVNDATDYRPAVRPGDRLSVVRETSRGFWIKKNGVTGWYSGRLERV